MLLFRNFSFRQGSKKAKTTDDVRPDSGFGAEDSRSRKRFSDVVDATVNSLCSGTGSSSAASTSGLATTPSVQPNIVRRRLDLS